jgi:hypothetical protein
MCPDEPVSVGYPEGTDDGKALPDWVAGEPLAIVEWLKGSPGEASFPKVTAMAQTWAKHEHGLICMVDC